MSFSQYRWLGFGLVGISMLAAGCNSPGSASGGGSAGESAEEVARRKWWSTPSPTPTPTPTPTATSSPAPTPTPTPTSTASSTPLRADALIFNGSGVHSGNALSLASIVQSHGLSYHMVSTEQLNAMTATELRGYRVFIWPGGDADVQNAGITQAARQRVKDAVRAGVSFTGFCAGAWIAVGPTTTASVPYWGFGLINGDYLKQYYPNGQDPSSAIVTTSFADGTKRQIVWWKGPILPTIAGGVVARYPEGYPAMIEAWAGSGYVTLSGLHPEAPQDWRYGVSWTDSDGLDYDVAWNLISGALNKQALRAF